MATSAIQKTLLLIVAVLLLTIYLVVNSPEFFKTAVIYFSVGLFGLVIYLGGNKIFGK